MATVIPFNPTAAMALRGGSKSDPLCIDSSPGPSFVAASPATSLSNWHKVSVSVLPAPLTIFCCFVKKRTLVRAWSYEKETDETSGESELPDSPRM